MGAFDKNFEMKRNIIITVILAAASILFVLPFIIVFLNSFRNSPGNSIGIKNYFKALLQTKFYESLKVSLIITGVSVVLIVFFSAMAAWLITRVKSVFFKALYYIFVFSITVPFQTLMFPLGKTAKVLHLDNPAGIILVHLGLCCGLSIFLFSIFIRALPPGQEEAAVLDGASPPRIFFRIILPMISPAAVCIAILNAVWIWNNYLISSLLLGNKYKTVPVALQYYIRQSEVPLESGEAAALIVLALLPSIVFFFLLLRAARRPLGLFRRGAAFFFANRLFQNL